MPWSLLVDVLLVLTLVAALVNGSRAGLLRTAGGLVGIVAGGIAAYFAMPWILTLVPEPGWRVTAAIASAIVLLSFGAWLGGIVGRTLGGGARAIRLGWLDRLLGAAAGAVVAAFVVVLVGGSVAGMGAPLLSPAFAGSAVLRALDTVTPEPARALLAEIRSATADQALPWLARVLDGPTESPELPQLALDNPALAEASDSVVRVTGTAFECGRSVSGSGFVAAPDRIVTNAHVVAGVSGPVVEAPGEPAVAGRVVAFDPVHDLAVIAVDGLDTAPLALAAPLGIGDSGAVAGYPFGGPFALGAAEVMASGPVLVDVDGERSTRDIVTLAADIEHGNSGGPLLTTDGRVAGVVFAKSEDVANVGFAIALGVVEPLVAHAAALTDEVGTGGCEG